MPNAESPDHTACRSGSPHGVLSGVHVLPVVAGVAAFAVLLSRVCAARVDAVSRTTNANVTENRTLMTLAPSLCSRGGIIAPSSENAQLVTCVEKSQPISSSALNCTL